MKKYRYLILIGTIFFIIAITYFIGKPLLAFMSDPKEFQLWISSKGIWGPAIFVILNIIQVLLAIIPGGPFEIGAGYAFGILKGSILCDIAMTTGAVLNFLLARKFGMKFVELFSSKEKLSTVKFLQANKKSETLLFIFFLFPGTPKDLISYVAGLSNIKLSLWILINLIGRFPAILLSALSGSALGTKRYEVFFLLIFIICVFYVLGTLIYNRHNKKKESS